MCDRLLRRMGGEPLKKIGLECLHRVPAVGEASFEPLIENRLQLRVFDSKDLERNRRGALHDLQERLACPSPKRPLSREGGIQQNMQRPHVVLLTRARARETFGAGEAAVRRHDDLRQHWAGTVVYPLEHDAAG